MLTDLCQELKNWFDRGLPKIYGNFSIHDGDLFTVAADGTETSISSSGLANNQYFRIIGSVFNDGVVKYANSALQNLTSEQFNGAVWFMAIPPSVISLDKEIDDWQAKFSDVSLSPYASESFGGYSYSKGSNSSSNGNDKSTWQGAFRSKLNKWRKL